MTRKHTPSQHLNLLLSMPQANQFKAAARICSCRVTDFEYRYSEICWQMLMEGRRVPCGQVEDCNVENLREEMARIL